MKTTTVETPLGRALIEGDENAVTRISITDTAEVATEIPTTSAEIPHELHKAVLQLQEYFAGIRTQFDFKMAPEGTEFQKRVWQELQNIPFGKTLSYLSLARELGDVKAIRAVAAANGKNPLWIVVPCHRVIGTDGSLTGYAGGLWRKKWLLEHENPPKQTALF